MAEYKKQGSCKVLLVTGCMAERYREEIHQEIPEVDAVLGTNSYDRILLAIEDVCAEAIMSITRPDRYSENRRRPDCDDRRLL